MQGGAVKYLTVQSTHSLENFKLFAQLIYCVFTDQSLNSQVVQTKQPGRSVWHTKQSGSNQKER